MFVIEFTTSPDLDTTVNICCDGSLILSETYRYNYTIKNNINRLKRRILDTLGTVEHVTIMGNPYGQILENYKFTSLITNNIYCLPNYKNIVNLELEVLLPTFWWINTAENLQTLKFNHISPMIRKPEIINFTILLRNNCTKITAIISPIFKNNSILAQKFRNAFNKIDINTILCDDSITLISVPLVKSASKR